MKLSEIRLDQTVYHPILGEGRVTKIDRFFTDEVEVKFGKYFEYFSITNLRGQVISHLYHEPVFVCIKRNYILTDGRGGTEYTTEYEPVNLDK